MAGCESRASTAASCWKRLAGARSSRTLRATSCPVDRSRARYTVAIPPTPDCSRIWNRSPKRRAAPPPCTPDVSALAGGLLTALSAAPEVFHLQAITTDPAQHDGPAPVQITRHVGDAAVPPPQQLGQLVPGGRPRPGRSAG